MGVGGCGCGGEFSPCHQPTAFEVTGDNRTRECVDRKCAAYVAGVWVAMMMKKPVVPVTGSTVLHDYSRAGASGGE